MSFAAQKDTLAYQLQARPLTLKRDASYVPMAEVVPQFDLVKGTATPDQDALWFYLLNHAVGEIRTRVEMDEPLGKYLWVLEAYNKMMVPRAQRLFTYLVNITARENRHEQGKPSLSTILETEVSPGAKTFFYKIKSMTSGEGGIPGMLKNSPPPISLGEFTRCMCVAFYKGNFHGGYGGPKWGNVADCMDRFVHGKFSAEMMLDVGFTLAHNGGPIFNKGMQYTHYDSAALAKILDCQRAGQIPQLIKSGAVNKFVNAEMKTVFEKLCELLPGFAGTGKVDFKAVKKLGGLHDYDENGNMTNVHAEAPTIPEDDEDGVIHAAASFDPTKQYEVVPGKLVLNKFKPTRSALEA